MITMRTLAAITTFVFAAWLVSAAPARAQGALVQGVVGAAVTEDQTSTAFSGGIGYRFNQALGLGVEVTHMPGLSRDVPRLERFDQLTRSYDTSATMFTTNIRVEIPTLSSRVIPYVVGGGGVGSIRSEFEVNYLALNPATGLSPMLRPGGATLVPGGPNRLSVLPGPSRVKSTSVHMVLTLGGGASILLTDHLSLDADLRLLSLFGDRDRNIGRFGIGASYRF